MEFIKKAVKVGNSAGVLLPKKFLGAEVKVTILKKSLDIKKEFLKYSYQFLEDVIAACVLQEDPLEILIITQNIKKIIKRKEIKISFVPLEILKKDFKNNEIVRAKIEKSKPFLNELFFKNLRNSFI